jgi:hypothetical protein
LFFTDPHISWTFNIQERGISHIEFSANRQHLFSVGFRVDSKTWDFDFVCRMYLQHCSYAFYGSIGQSGLTVTLMLMLPLPSTLALAIEVLVIDSCPFLWLTQLSKKR